MGCGICPSLGKFSGRPSITRHFPARMICGPRLHSAKGVDSIDLLGYRYTGDAATLNRAFIAAVHAPICLAGSVNTLPSWMKSKLPGPRISPSAVPFCARAFLAGISPMNQHTVCDYMEAPRSLSVGTPAHVPSVFAIDYEKLAAGLQGILFDIDNTLVHHGDDSTPEVDALFRHIHSLG